MYCQKLQRPSKWDELLINCHIQTNIVIFPAIFNEGIPERSNWSKFVIDLSHLTCATVIKSHKSYDLFKPIDAEYSFEYWPPTLTTGQERLQRFDRLQADRRLLSQLSSQFLQLSTC